MESELDRIWDHHLLDERLDRRRASPVYKRNRRLYQDHLHGVSVLELTLKYGLRSVRVHDVTRQETGWSKLLGHEIDGSSTIPLVHWSPRALPHPPVYVAPNHFTASSIGFRYRG